MKSNNSWLLSQRLLWVGAEGQLATMDPSNEATTQGDFVQRKTTQSKTEAVAGKGRRANAIMRLLTVGKALYFSTVNLLAPRRKAHEEL
jgi:hypothetical protein